MDFFPQSLQVLNLNLRSCRSPLVTAPFTVSSNKPYTKIMKLCYCRPIHSPEQRVASDLYCEESVKIGYKFEITFLNFSIIFI